MKKYYVYQPSTRRILTEGWPAEAAIVFVLGLNASTENGTMALPLTSVRVDTPGLREYMHRLINFREQCDFEYTFYTMLCLCVDPRRAYRNAEYHSRTKHQWARDDPGFVVVMSALLATSITSWTIAFGPISLGGWLLNVAYTVLVDFVLVGLAIAGLGWCAPARASARCSARRVARADDD